MEQPRRLSMNTSLKDAKIFDYDSGEESNGAILKFEDLIKEKQAEEQGIKMKIKKEKIEDDFDPEFRLDPWSDYPDAPVLAKNIKVESEYNSSDNCDIAMGKLGLQTPIKSETADEGLGKSNLKSAKRTLLKQRNSPYSKSSPSATNEEKKSKKRDFSCCILEEEVESKVRKTSDEKRGEKKFETDPVVLERRQKQIDFGKNTVGYDNFISQVPKDKRTSEDPVTPNKYRVYSRRGFDGLIKQWRLKLHKYDP